MARAHEPVKGTYQHYKGALYEVLGVAEEPDSFFTDWDDAMEANLAATIATQDAVILGRRSHDEWAGYWPDSDIEPFASFINGVAKHYGLLDEEAAAPPPAPKPAAAAAALEGFTVNHVGMAVPNIDAFLASNDILYKNFRKTPAVVNDRQHVREVFITDGKTVIELLEPTGEGSPLNGFLKKNRAGGLIHV